MKVKTDFVTNSSSTSYICEVCGASETMWDGGDMLEYGFIYCEEEHMICTEHVDEFNYEDMARDGQLKREYCPICLMDTYSQTEMVKYLLKTRSHTQEDAFAEVKAANKRRKKLYDHEFISYVFRQDNLDEDEMMKTIKEEFENHGAFYKFINKREAIKT